MVDREQVESFLNHLYAPGQRFELVAVKDGNARRHTFTLDEANVLTVLDATTTFEEREWNVYASAMPLDVQESGEYDRVWVDRDDPEAPWPFGADAAWEYPAWPQPTTLVRTSRAANGARWQAIWLLDEPIPAEKAKKLMKTLAVMGQTDKSVHDARRVLRVPGVRNSKRDSNARLLSTTSGKTTIESFMVPKETTSDEVTIQSLMRTPVSAPHEVLGEWLEGSEEGDRARKAFVTARFLKSCKVKYDDALAIVNTGAKRADPPLSDAEVVHSVKSAYNRQD